MVHWVLLLLVEKVVMMLLMVVVVIIVRIVGHNLHGIVFMDQIHNIASSPCGLFRVQSEYFAVTL